MDDVQFGEIIESLIIIEKDNSVPRNVRIRIRTAIDLLNDSNEPNVDLKVGRSLEELGNVADDPNIPSYTRMQIWSALSQLENR